MADDPNFPILGLPLAELQAALAAVGRILPRADDRILSARLLKDGRVEVTTGDELGPLAGSGRYLVARKTATGWVADDGGRWVS